MGTSVVIQIANGWCMCCEMAVHEIKPEISDSQTSKPLATHHNDTHNMQLNHWLHIIMIHTRCAIKPMATHHNDSRNMHSSKALVQWTVFPYGSTNTVYQLSKIWKPEFGSLSWEWNLGNLPSHGWVNKHNHTRVARTLTNWADQTYIPNQSTV